MVAHYFFEEWKDGYWSCIVRESFERFGLLGYGDTKELALADMKVSYDEFRDMAEEEGWECPELEFVEEKNE